MRAVEIRFRKIERVGSHSKDKHPDRYRNQRHLFRHLVGTILEWNLCFQSLNKRDIEWNPKPKVQLKHRLDKHQDRECKCHTDQGLVDQGQGADR